MASWNKDGIFNRNGEEGGFVWNSDEYINVVTISDRITVRDDISDLLIKLILSEDAEANDETEVLALFEQDDGFFMKDDEPFVTLLIQVAEELGIKDEIAELLVNLYLEDNQKALDKIKLMVELLEAEDFSFEDITDIYAFFAKTDSFKMEDIEAFSQAWLYLHDRFNLTDREPRKAISDFLIGSADGLEKSMDYFIPLNMMIDWANTDIPIMPRAELTEINLPSTDSSLIADTTYRDRVFKLTLYSEQGLTIAEKEDVKRRISQVLDSTKMKSKKLTVESRGISFDCRYEGEEKHAEGPSFVKAEIGLRVGAYGYSMFPTEIYGSGLLNNAEGAAPLRVKHTITGPVTNPTFAINGITYTWRGTVSSGYKLIIDHNNYTCYTIDNYGNKRNALQYLSGEFTSIPPGESAVLVASSNTESRILTEYSTPLLW